MGVGGIVGGEASGSEGVDDGVAFGRQVVEEL